MNTTIEWKTFKPAKRGGRGASALTNHLRLRYQSKTSKKENANYRMHFSRDISKIGLPFKFVRFGKLQNKVVFQFNDSNGVVVTKQPSPKGYEPTARIYGKEMCEFIVTNMGLPIIDGFYDMQTSQLSDSTFLIDSIKFEI